MSKLILNEGIFVEFSVTNLLGGGGFAFSSVLC
jgi:hypothetical protein